MVLVMVNWSFNKVFRKFSNYPPSQINIFSTNVCGFARYLPTLWHAISTEEDFSGILCWWRGPLLVCHWTAETYFTLTCFRFRTALEPSTTSPMTSSTGPSYSCEGVNFAFASLDSIWACPSFIFSKRFSVKDCARDSHSEMWLSQGRD